MANLKDRATRKHVEGLFKSLVGGIYNFLGEPSPYDLQKPVAFAGGISLIGTEEKVLAALERNLTPLRGMTPADSGPIGWDDGKPDPEISMRM